MPAERAVAFGYEELNSTDIVHQATSGTSLPKKHNMRGYCPACKGEHKRKAGEPNNPGRGYDMAEGRKSPKG